ncbi:hypothetical protein BD779DRAFT_1673589 [Infundibulicybe gibba]|nr:hypothetical protein BD779DRAFT_1673589 [Infundibulicybe gibba]
MPVDLPVELVREILLYVAQTSTSSCRTLCEVSTWARKLALPILYTTVSLNHLTLEPFARVVTSSSLVYPSSPTFCPADAVRHIWVSPTMFVPLRIIIRHCKNATHFAFNRIGLSALSAAIDPSVAIFRETQARLRSVRFGLPIDLEYSLVISHIRGLTHLATPSEGATERKLNNICEIITRSSIEVFVLVMTREQIDEGQRQQIDDWVYRAQMRDARIHAVMPLFDDIRREWDVEIQGGVTIWERAVEYTRLLMSRA